MKGWLYLKYFWYLTKNWNPVIATHLLKQEIKGEKKYGIHTSGEDELKSLENLGVDISHATIYMPASYSLLEELLSLPLLKKYNYFVDIGCGKGRALCVAAYFDFKKVLGLELSKDLCKIAKENIAVTKKIFPQLDGKIINNDAYYFEIETDMDCLFMFNPFDEFVMEAVMENVKISLAKKDRPMAIIYLNNLHEQPIINAGFKEVYNCKSLQYLQGSVYEYRPAFKK